jgi:glycosyltransferase involved in cell wall biosynthesis
MSEDRRVRRVLYLSYDGMTDPLGQSQVIPYVRRLARLGYRYTLVSFEKPAHFGRGRAGIQRQMDEAGIRWIPMRYTKHPPVASGMWDVLRLALIVLRLQRERAFDIVHCRSYVTSLVGLELRRRCGVKFVFDMRAFWADERVDGNLWNLRNPLYRMLYRYFKNKEVQFIRYADAIVSLTHAGKNEMESWSAGRERKALISVIPCSVDFDLFAIPTAALRVKARQALEIDEHALVITYLGSIGTWYLIDQMLEFFSIVKQRYPSSKFVFLTPQRQEILRSLARRSGLDLSDLRIRFVPRKEVPFYLSAGDVGLFFIMSSYSKVSSSPTKLGEYLAMGIPVVTNAGVGDVDRILQQVRGGLLVDELSMDGYRKVVDQLDRLKTIDPYSLRQNTRTILDLSTAVDEYDHLYRRLLTDMCADKG